MMEQPKQTTAREFLTFMSAISVEFLIGSLSISQDVEFRICHAMITKYIQDNAKAQRLARVMFALVKDEVWSLARMGSIHISPQAILDVMDRAKQSHFDWKPQEDNKHSSSSSLAGSKRKREEDDEKKNASDAEAQDDDQQMQMQHEHEEAHEQQVVRKRARMSSESEEDG
jgi:hypothetical protein